MNNDYYEFNICDAYARAIINNDYSGLDDKESNLLTNFLDDLKNTMQERGHKLLAIDGFDENDSTGFSFCDVCNLLGNCYIVRFSFCQA